MLIYLNCPQCGEPHELGDQFSGGVYRCQKCQTLMTVPRVAAQPSGPVQEEFDASPARDVRAGNNRGPAAPPAPRMAAGSAPVNRKKTYALFGVIGVVVLALVIGLVVVLAKAPVSPPVKDKKLVDPLAKQPGPSETKSDDTAPVPPSATRPLWAFDYDAKANIFSLKKPNVFGIPLPDSPAGVFVVVDGDPQLDPVRPLVHEALESGLGNQDATIRLGMAYTASVNPPLAPAMMTERSAGAVKEWLEARVNSLPGFAFPLTLGGLLPKLTSVDEAPERLILILGHTLDTKESDSIKDKLADLPAGMKVDVVTIGVDLGTELQALISNRQGRHVHFANGEALATAWVEAFGKPHPSFRPRPKETLVGPSQGLVVAYGFEDVIGDLVLDLAPHEFNLTLDTGVQTVPGRHGQGLKITSSNGALARFPVTMPKLDDSWSVACWLRRDGTGGSSAETLLESKVAGKEMHFRIRQFGSDGKFGMTIRHAADYSFRTATPALGQWIHYCMTKRDNQYLLFLDGKEVDRMPAIPGFVLSPSTLSSTIKADMGDVTLDDFRIYDRALSTEEVEKLAQ